MIPLHKQLFINLLELKIETKEEIKYDSFFTLIEEYLKLEKSIENASAETVDYLIRARQDYIKDILFEIENSPFSKYDNFYSGDLLTIKNIIKGQKIDFELLKIIFNTFHKKRTINYFTNIQRILDNQKRIDFKYIFILVDNLLQEINYHNFSYEKIKSLLKYTSDKYNICLEIQHSFDSKSEKKFPLCLIKVEVPKELEGQDLLIIDNVKFYKVYDVEWNLVSTVYSDLYKEHLEKFFITENNKIKYKSKGNLYLFETQNLDGADYQTRIRKAAQSVESNLKDLMSNTGTRKKNIIHTTAYTFTSEAPDKYRAFNIAVAGSKNIPVYQNRNKRDVQEFYKEYLSSFHKENFKLDSFKTIYNLLDLIKNTSEMTVENKLVILWSCLEKICVDLNRKAIIQKVQQIITKSHLMYILKQDLNEIWHGIVENNFHNQIEVLKEVIVDPSDDFVKYKPKELFVVLKGMDKENQTTIMEKDIVLAALINSFQENMKDKNTIKKYLKIEKSRVEQNIRRIYRHRNILTHTHSQQNFDIMYFVMKLEKYLSGLISIIIHYTLRNPELTIKDIIYAIDQTYNYYESTIIDSNDYNSILKPHYLLL
ncbi:hypothetical protein [Priestia megaterium]|uniref:hypothetical protein n=1 Tax=Priestia megaterium TaxID=1404 RepID=UPI000762A785|nr:hypothetical protein [Priestia megaterium]KWU61141.1 hypothetical protein AWX17_18685 [Priestia megaterium]